MYAHPCTSQKRQAESSGNYTSSHGLGVRSSARKFGLPLKNEPRIKIKKTKRPGQSWTEEEDANFMETYMQVCGLSSRCLWAGLAGETGRWWRCALACVRLRFPPPEHGLRARAVQSAAVNDTVVCNSAADRWHTCVLLVQFGKKWKDIRDTLETDFGIKRTREQVQTRMWAIFPAHCVRSRVCGVCAELR